MKRTAMGEINGERLPRCNDGVMAFAISAGAHNVHGGVSHDFVTRLPPTSSRDIFVNRNLLVFEGSLLTPKGRKARNYRLKTVK